MHKPSQELRAAAKAVLVAKAAVEAIRPKVYAIQDNLIFQLSPKVSEEYDEDRGEYVLRENAWMMTDEDAARYYPALDKEYRKAGFTEIETGQCPLLIAENLLRQAEALFIEQSVELTARVGIDAQMAEDIARAMYSLDRRKEYIELTLRYVVPFIPAAELKSLTQRR